MLLEYPEYIERFRCIGGRCPDTCCAGWEVDVDEESCRYYESVPGAFGERLRKELRREEISGAEMKREDPGKEEGGTEEGAGFFPLTEEGRCPFLDRAGLCEIYTELGEESLCRVCTEYPRYYIDIGEYEQMDMSLSCIELCRIFLETEGPLRYLRAETEPSGDEIPEEEEAKLIELLALRNQAILLLQERGGTLSERLAEVAALFEGGEQLFTLRFEESGEELLERLSSLELLNACWTEQLRELRSFLSSEEGGLLTGRLPENAAWEPLFTKLSVYFVFRYFIDACTGDTLERAFRLLLRSLRTIELMLLARQRSRGTEFGKEDIIELIHLYSREVEHSEENVERMKEALL